MAPRTSFFKVLLEDFHKYIRIPPRFVQCMPTIMSSTGVVLKGPGGGKWHVKLLKKSNGNIYLEDGWENFVHDHSLRKAHFLIFKYTGAMRFTVQIFDQTACEVEDELIFKPNQESWSYNELDRKNKLQKNVRVHATKPSAVEVHVEKRPSKKGPATHTSAEKLIAKHRGTGTVSTAKNPSLKLQMKCYNVEKGKYLLFPRKFCDAYMPSKGPVSLVVRNAKGDGWNLKYIPQTRVLSAGWSQFVDDNNLKVGDECTFELVGDLIFKVYVMRSKLNDKITRKLKF